MKVSRTLCYSQAQSQALNATSFAPVTWLHCVFVVSSPSLPRSSLLSLCRSAVLTESCCLCRSGQTITPTLKSQPYFFCPPKSDPFLSSAPVPAPQKAFAVPSVQKRFPLPFLRSLSPCTHFQCDSVMLSHSPTHCTHA